MYQMVTGSIVALVTPFHEDGSVNYEKLEELLEWHVANGTDGILVLGTSGESSTLSHEEDAEVLKFTVKTINHRLPVIAGSGSNCTQTAVDKSKEFEQLGADQLLVITPYYNKATPLGMIRHFTTVAEAVKLPVIMYNVPGRTGCSLSEEAVKELSRVPNICGIKEASGNISYATNIARYLDDQFVMYSGNDDMITTIMALGGSGVISVLANIAPRQTHDIAADYLAGNVKKSLEGQLKYLDVIHDLFCEVNPVPVKEALNLMGMNVGGYRLPLCEMTEAHRAQLAASMKAAGLI
ncbi:MAG: 4-hydroxy-tetrahydrodipicolinate synthase [Eubacteriales bacterium]|nr:4-hydroxy-tetrahydrodipicolinate synthase [Eubacteriales bacterium]